MVLFEFVDSSFVLTVKTVEASSCEYGSEGRRDAPAQAGRRLGTAVGRGL